MPKDVAGCAGSGAETAASKAASWLVALRRPRGPFSVSFPPPPNGVHGSHWAGRMLPATQGQTGKRRPPTPRPVPTLVHRHPRHGASAGTDTALPWSVSRGPPSPSPHLDLADRFLVLLVSRLEEGLCLMDQVAQILLLLGTQSKGGRVRRGARAAGAEQGQGTAGQPVGGRTPGSPRPEGRCLGCSW